MQLTKNLKKLVVLSAALNAIFIAWGIKHYMFMRRQVSKPVSNVKPFYDYRYQYFKMLPNEDNEIVFVGDSETEYFLVSEMFKNARVKNRGIAGDNSKGVLNRIDEVIDSKPKKVFLEVGINDISNKVPLNVIANNIKETVFKIKSFSPSTEIYIQSVLPVKDKCDSIAALNKSISKIPGSSYIDLFTSFNQNNALNHIYDCGDKVHLNGNGYIKWKEIIEKYVGN